MGPPGAVLEVRYGPMSTHRLVVSAAGALLAGAIVAGPAIAPASATPAPPTLPQVSAAQEAGSWLDGQLNASGYIPSTTTPGTPDLESTANTILALAATGVDP